MAISKYLGEFVGTATLLMANVGSASMAENLTDNSGVRILINCLSTALVLGLLILIFARISGSHFNPAVTLVELVGKRISMIDAMIYIFVQVLGGISGVVIANLMYSSPALVSSTIERNGTGILLGEVVATAGLLFVINTLRIQKKAELTPLAVGVWIASAFLFTSSTAFANPAVTFARSWTPNISGIASQSVYTFVAVQLVGAIIGASLAQLFTNKSSGDKK